MMFTLRVWIVAVLCCAAFAAAQPLRDVEILDPPVVLEALREAYRAAPFAEEITARVRVSGRLRIDRFEIRADAKGSPPRLRFALGDLDVWVSGRRFAAVNRREPATCFVRELEAGLLPDALAGVLPPVPAPQIELAFGDGAFSRPLPYMRDVEWYSAQREHGRAAAVTGAITLAGRTPTGSVRLTIDPVTNRLRTLTASLTRDEQSPVLDIELRFQPLPAGDPETWAIDVTGRREAPSLTDLRPLPKRLTAGDPVPDVTTYTTDLEAGSLLDSLASGGPNLELVLVLYRVERTEPLSAAESAARHAFVVAHNTSAGQVRRPRVLGAVAVFPLMIFEPDTLTKLEARWGETISSLNHAPQVRITPIRWTPAMREALASHDPAARVVISRIAPDGALLASISLDVDADEAARAAEVHSLLAR